MTVVLKNNVSSTLATPISASDTGMVVVDGDQFPTLAGGEYFYATLMSPAGTTEIVKVTARVANAMTIVRAQDGTSAASFTSGALVEMRVTAASMLDAASEYSTAAAISIADAGGYYTGTNVEAALQEAAQAGTTQITDAAGYYTGTNVEAALQEAAQAGTTQITDAGGYYTATDVEGALQEAGLAQSTAYTFRTISVAGQDDVVADAVADTLTLAAGTNIAITTTAGTDTITVNWVPDGEKVFATQAEAQAYDGFTSPAAAPDTIFLGGFLNAGEFGYAKAYRKVAVAPGHGGQVTISTYDVTGTTGTVYYEPDTSGWVTPRMYGSGNNDTSAYDIGASDDGMDGVLDALTYGTRVDLGRDQTFVGEKTYTILNRESLQVRGERIQFYASNTRLIGDKGVFLWFLNINFLDWDVDCDMYLRRTGSEAGRYSGGLVTRAKSTASRIIIKRTRVHGPNYNSEGTSTSLKDPYSSPIAWCSIGIGCEGWFNINNLGPFEYALLHIEDCAVYDVVRAIDPTVGDIFPWSTADANGVYPAMTTGFWLGEAFRTRLINSKVNGVFLGNTTSSAPASARDADCVVYKTRQVSNYSISSNNAAYYPGEFIMEGCDIRNGQGRLVKIQAAGPMTIRNNYFAIDRTTISSSDGPVFALISAGGGAWYAIDCQDEPAIIEKNQFYFRTKIADQSLNGSALVALRAGVSGVGPLAPANNPSNNPIRTNSRRLFGAFRDNYVFFEDGTEIVARCLDGGIVYVDNSGMVTTATAQPSDYRDLTLELNRNIVVHGLGYNGSGHVTYPPSGSVGCVARAFYNPNLADFNGTSATLRIAITNNDLDTAYLVQASGATGTVHTGQFTMVVKDNVTHSTTPNFAFGTGPQTANVINVRQNA
ncbi:MAG: hypothetical protein ACO3PY_02525 [Pontimonas sp.]